MMIHPVTNKDLSRITEIDQGAFKNGFWSKENYENEFENNPYANLYVYKKGEILGFIDFWISFEIGDITRIAVDPNYQRKGIAKELLEFALMQMKKENCEYCQLEVRSSNQAAISLYEKFGFEKINIRSHYYENQEDALVMNKVL
ncbi:MULTISPECIES: ribosomal protein S18-alanine N-acetyltransferase [Terrabacteria group]|uniref:ribosomal protein S18-alanine N-acetyltransferase n=1 Tax=Bacillati TaxID=1783272 RepID=UPI001C6E936F|nr:MULTISPECIES: ribosomal protein S18-alanine N-acetyltransferase [Terrabacteria group]MBW9213170.1 ribosomal protein S18-alanine N-acetyltransferase [Trueperella sp. zg.1013]